ncbi:MAG: T9SS type A sorting domain-containing protein [Fluviicola sp.]
MKFFNSILLSLAFVVPSLTIAQSNGCGGSPPALPVNAACVNQGFTNNQNGTGQTVNASCAGGYGTAYQDVWYTVTGTGNLMTITMSGANRDGVLAAFTGCGTGELACNTVDAGTSGSINFPTTLGTTYFIQIQRRSGNNNNNMNGNICAVSAAGGGLPNDDPCSATPLTVNSTCINTSSTNAGATDSGIPDPGCAAYSGGDVWFSVVVPASGNITVTTADNGGLGDDGLAVYSGPCGAPTLLGCDDDGGAGLFSSLSLTGQTPGATLLVRVWEFGGGAGGTFDICATEPSFASNTVCTAPDPICSGTPIVFTANDNGVDADVVNPGNNYDCLLTSPNPSWFYLEIATAGNLVIDITAGSDIDYAIWGPYADLPTAIATCDAHGVPQDCSYSTAAVEQANVTGVNPGEVYVLLVTNFASTVQTITVDEAASNTASTDCSIVPLPIELVDFGGSSLGSSVQLNWSTISERDNDFFIAERSSDGHHWTSFAMIDGAGNSNTLRNYEVIDQNPHEATSYYRLKQFDFDGSVTTSSVISVSRNAGADVKVYPNPAKDQLKIKASENINRVDIVSVSGAIVKSVELFNTSETTVNVSDVTNGVYLANIYTENEKIVKRMIVRNE